MIPRPVRSNPAAPRDIEWPEWPKPHQHLSGALFDERPALRKLAVLVDAELLAPENDTSVKPNVLLTGLLTHPYIKALRYRDDGPFPDTPRKTYGTGLAALTAAEGWAELLTLPDGNGHEVVYVDASHVIYGAIYGSRGEYARHDLTPSAYADLDPTEAADKRERDALAAQIAEAVQADLFITERPYVFATQVSLASGVTICRVPEALALIGLYLRSQKEFITWRAADGLSTITNEWRYYDIATRELLPAAWQWSSILGKDSQIGQGDLLGDLAGSVWRRIQRVLLTRDRFHRAYRLPQNNDTARIVITELDSILISLMGAVDGTARIAHLIFGVPGRLREAGWQKYDRWLPCLAKRAPALAALFDSGTGAT